MGRNVGMCPFLGGAGSPSNTMSPGPRPTFVSLHTKWHLDQSSHFATIDVGRKLEVVPFFWQGAGSPFNAMSPGPTATIVPSGILIDPAVWPQ